MIKLNEHSSYNLCIHYCKPTLIKKRKRNKRKVHISFVLTTRQPDTIDLMEEDVKNLRRRKNDFQYFKWKITFELV